MIFYCTVLEVPGGWECHGINIQVTGEGATRQDALNDALEQVHAGASIGDVVVS